jgi:hypothetical protein
MEGTMADTKDQVVETTEIVEETTNSQTTPNAYGFSQEQVDEVVAKRLARERESVAKKLGVESYEKIDSFLEGYQGLIQQKEEINSKYEESIDHLFDRELRLSALNNGVKPEHLDRAVKLITAELDSFSDDDLDIDKALENVLNDFPMFKGQEQPVRKVGAETRNEVSEKTEIDQYLDKYKNSKYYRK